MRALGIDPATVTGFAHGELGRRPIGGTIGLTGHRGLRYNTLMGRVRQLIQDNEIDMVYVESSYITLYARKSGITISQDQVELAYGYLAAIRMACDRSGVAERVVLVSANEWRSKAAIGRVPKHLQGAERRKWLKAQAMQRCADYGWSPKTEDEAEAMLIWAYAECLHEQGASNQRMPLFNVTAA